MGVKLKIPPAGRTIIFILVIIAVVIFVIVFFKLKRDNSENVHDIFGDEIDIEELPQVQDLYNLPSLADFRSYNPCIFSVDKIKEPFYAYRMCNFALCPGKTLKWDQNNRELTESHTFIQSPDGELYIVSLGDLGKLSHPKCERGCEDARSFVVGHKLMLVCNIPSAENCRREMHIIEVDLNEFELGKIMKRQISGTEKYKIDYAETRVFIKEVKPLSISKINISFDNHRDQKNWMPFVINEDIYFVYSVNPHVILKYVDGTCVKIATSNNKLPQDLRGGSQIIRSTKWKKVGSDRHGEVKYMGEDLYIGVVHIRDSTFQYTTYIYAFDVHYPYAVKYITRGFVFGSASSHSKIIQFASGMCRVVENDVPYLYITYGENDCTGKLCKIKEERVMRALRKP